MAGSNLKTSHLNLPLDSNQNDIHLGDIIRMGFQSGSSRFEIVKSIKFTSDKVYINERFYPSSVTVIPDPKESEILNAFYNAYKTDESESTLQEFVSKLQEMKSCS